MYVRWFFGAWLCIDRDKQYLQHCAVFCSLSAGRNGSWSLLSESECTIWKKPFFKRSGYLLKEGNSLLTSTSYTSKCNTSSELYMK